MRATKIIRRIDELGRIVIPKGVRSQLGIKEGDPFELFTQGRDVILKRYQPTTNISNVLDELKRMLAAEPNLKCGPTLLEKVAEMQLLLAGSKVDEE
ncbi:MAG: AbrB/MazE/SpoVT family DNA-binding domain-containing protein [Elusimicrobiales bacterium]|nr:AbrB/MazE/SpoVT family DNA-binding domain-containing protein [Elusimicrobiales bacterium]